MLHRTGTAESRDRPSRRRRQPRSRPQGIERAGAVLLVIAVAGSALLIGAQHSQVLLPVALAAAGAALCCAPKRLPWLGWLLVGLAGYTLLQLVPLPLGAVAVLSPEAAEVWRDSLEPFGESSLRWASLSVDPGATALEAVKWFGYACVLLAAVGWRDRRGGGSLALLVFCSALAVSVVTLAHGVLDASRIYGMFLPIGTERWTRGPIPNPNPLSGYLNLGLFAGVGYWLSRPDGRVARFMPLGFALLSLHVVLTRSRGGVLSFVAGAVVLAFLVARQRRPDWVRIGGIVAAGLVASVGVAIVVGGPALQDELFNTGVDGKVAAWRWSLALIRDYPVFGVGRGAFETAFQPYRQPLGRDWTTIFAHAENFPLEWVSDWGVPVGLAALGGCFLAGRGLVRRALREPLAAGVVIALGVLFLHNLADLGLEIFAVSAAALVAYAAVQSPPSSERGRNVGVGVAAAGVLVSCIVVVVLGAAPVKVERERLARAYAAFVKTRSRDGSELFAQVRASIRRHPAEAYFPLMGGLVARRTGKGDPLRWLGRALERGPINGNTHMALAQVLAERGARQQAMIHIRLTALYDVTLRDYALRQAARWAKTGSELVAVFPRDLPGSELIDDLCHVAVGEPQVGCWREAVARRASTTGRRRLARALLDALEVGQAPCTKETAPACESEVDRLLVGLVKEEPEDWRNGFLRARLLGVRGDSIGAARAALDGCPASPDANDCITRALDFASAARDHATLASAADRYLALHCADAASCAVAHERLGKVYASLEMWGAALSHFGSASKAEPTTDRWIQNAEAAVKAGSSTSARIALERARRGANLDDGQRKRVASVESLLEGGLSPR